MVGLLPNPSHIPKGKKMRKGNYTSRNTASKKESLVKYHYEANLGSMKQHLLRGLFSLPYSVKPDTTCSWGHKRRRPQCASRTSGASGTCLPSTTGQPRPGNETWHQRGSWVLLVLMKGRREHTAFHVFLKYAFYLAREYTKSYIFWAGNTARIQLWKVKNNLIFIWNCNYFSPPTYSPTLD